MATEKWTEKNLLGWLDVFESDSGYRLSLVYLVCNQLKKIVREWFGLQNWTCTFREYYALPEPIRKYIAALETNADPPSMVRENVVFKETIAALERKNELLILTIEAKSSHSHVIKPIVTRAEIENAVGDTSDEYVEGVIELFESKDFEVIK